MYGLLSMCKGILGPWYIYIPFLPLRGLLWDELMCFEYHSSYTIEVNVKFEIPVGVDLVN